MKKRFVVRKYMGDDKYSWAVFDSLTGRPVCTGCGRKEAQFYRDTLEVEHGKSSGEATR